MTPEQRKLNEEWAKLEGWVYSEDLSSDHWETPPWEKPNGEDVWELPNWAGDANLFFAEVVPIVKALGIRYVNFTWETDKRIRCEMKACSFHTDYRGLPFYGKGESETTAGLTAAIEARKELEGE